MIRLKTKQYYLLATLSNVLFFGVYLLFAVLELKNVKRGDLSYSFIFYIPGTLIYAFVYGLYFYKKIKKLLFIVILYCIFHTIFVFVLWASRDGITPKDLLSITDALPFALFNTAFAAFPGIYYKLRQQKSKDDLQNTENSTKN